MRRWLIILLTALGALTAVPAALADTGVSSNWAGYAVHGATFRRVIGSWREPAVACARGQQTYSAYWVGLGGFSPGSQALEQIGTEADCDLDGHPKLSAWYEMVPAVSTNIALPVAAGDLMQAAVTVVGHRATLTLRDVTSGGLFRRTVTSAYIDVSSAEWIVEAPSDCPNTCLTLPLANFGTAVFWSARAQTRAGRWGAVLDHQWRATQITLSPTGARFAAYHGTGHSAGGALTQNVTDGGSSFSVSYTRVLVADEPFGAVGHTGRRVAPLVRPIRTVAPTS